MREFSRDIEARHSQERRVFLWGVLTGVTLSMVAAAIISMSGMP